MQYTHAGHIVLVGGKSLAPDGDCFSVFDDCAGDDDVVVSLLLTVDGVGDLRSMGAGMSDDSDAFCTSHLPHYDSHEFARMITARMCSVQTSLDEAEVWTEYGGDGEIDECVSGGGGRERRGRDDHRVRVDRQLCRPMRLDHVLHHRQCTVGHRARRQRRCVRVAERTGRALAIRTAYGCVDCR